MRTFGREYAPAPAKHLRRDTTTSSSSYGSVSISRRSSRLALVTEKIDSTLKDRYTAGMSVEEQLGVFSDVAAGLTYIHRKGGIRRDLTKRNVLLNKHGRSGEDVRRQSVKESALRHSHVGNLHGDAVDGGADPVSRRTKKKTPKEKLSNRSPVIARREPSSNLLFSPRSQRLADGTERKVPELLRRRPTSTLVPQRAHRALSEQRPRTSSWSKRTL